MYFLTSKSIATAGLTAIAGIMTVTAAMADYSLTILHTNDFHARFQPISKYDNACGADANAEGKCFGGSARLVSAVSDARARAGNSILVDGGDQFQGSLFYTYYKGKVAAEMMNKLGYDAMTVGNHEFDDGPKVLREFIDNVKFPVLMSNADITREPLLASSLPKSVVIERGGEKLGLIGLTPIDTHELASPGNNITFTDPAKAVQQEVDKLTANGINKIIVLSHSSYMVDQHVAARTTGVDVIVGGHSNTYLSNVSDRATGPYPTMVGDTAIVQAYAYGKFLGELNVIFDDAGKIKSASGEPLTLDKEVQEDAPTKTRIATLAKPLVEIEQKIVASADAKIIGDRDVCRVQECAMGNLVADAMLAEVADQGVTIAIQNSGGLRASIDAGDVSMGEVYSVLPFQNTLSTFKVTGATLVAALENGVSQIEDVKGRFPQVAGMKFTFDASVAPNEGRITSVMVKADGGWESIDKDALYYVVSNNYVRGGGDGYKMFRAAQDVYDYGPDLADVVAAYMATHAPYKPFTEGRIVQQ
ncbi:bifunctional metallophosphatase/5'-nucleotidase [Candidatus Puniceispirillum sp.]|jgi:5'-nucleotidase / UDP-sugar diphosphatase|uniref:bifunctional metallophosphatase/5'-nucleotidase n=1 Tax=Candidatus Puniceispirillum sp. TaxID=2026719 RepID=UPI001EC3273B|nr:multifunctional 2',3'-cyclic-nucleotide 2'-phosphodiesterase/5'-nucleotidase/3'-nucleotidase [Candidatus Puniceispirillum sp.]MBT6567099.1 multifunctional 2',3'-cyclic-nucleotide 2'-phosphodiesterase/5'-nucleotidase/3'-nucleotidase [Candidatus Puniceispirillum sp.]